MKNAATNGFYAYRKKKKNQKFTPFGCSLDQFPRNQLSARVPIVAAECLSAIEDNFLRQEGLFRVPGNHIRVKELRQYYNGSKKSTLNKVTLSEENGIDVAQLLKDFLRELPEPLLSKEQIPRMLSIHRQLQHEVANGNTNLWITEIRSCIEWLHPTARWLLARLLYLLSLVELNKQYNKVECHKVSEVFGPILMYSDNQMEAEILNRDKDLINSFVCCLIQYYTEFLPEHFDKHFGSLRADSKKPANDVRAKSPLSVSTGRPNLSNTTKSPASASTPTLPIVTNRLARAESSPSIPSPSLNKRTVSYQVITKTKPAEIETPQPNTSQPNVQSRPGRSYTTSGNQSPLSDVRVSGHAVKRTSAAVAAAAAAGASPPNLPPRFRPASDTTTTSSNSQKRLAHTFDEAPNRNATHSMPSNGPSSQLSPRKASPNPVVTQNSQFSPSRQPHAPPSFSIPSHNAPPVPPRKHRRSVSSPISQVDVAAAALAAAEQAEAAIVAMKPPGRPPPRPNPMLNPLS